MIVRTSAEADIINWGNGQSVRMLVEQDRMGFAVAHTIVSAGTESKMQYTRHLEACYCIRGRGKVHTADEGAAHAIEPGTIYALDQHEAHVLVADPEEDMHLISVFNPPLVGDEKHELSLDGFSRY